MLDNAIVRNDPWLVSVFLISWFGWFYPMTFMNRSLHRVTSVGSFG